MTWRNSISDNGGGSSHTIGPGKNPSSSWLFTALVLTALWALALFPLRAQETTEIRIPAARALEWLAEEARRQQETAIYRAIEERRERDAKAHGCYEAAVGAYGAFERLARAGPHVADFFAERTALTAVAEWRLRCDVRAPKK